MSAVRLTGYREFMRATAKAEKGAKRVIRQRMRVAGDIVKRAQMVRMAPVDGPSAAGYRTKVRQSGITVEQTLGRTTGKRGDFAAMQKRRLARSSEENRDDVVDEVREALEELAEMF